MHYQVDALRGYSLCDLKGCLFPLNQWDKVKEGKKGQRVELGKIPLHKRWPKENVSEEQILTHIERGGNVGFRIPKDWVIVDLDPRNYPSGVEPIDIQDQVAELLGFFDWEEIEWDCNLVRTGSGGYHIYCQLPDQDIYKRVRTKIKGLPGVDIKRHGGYVVAAGSRHPNGDWYSWEAELTPQSVVKLDGTALEGLLREVNDKSGDTHESYGVLNGTELQSTVLDRLNPTDFGDNDSWFPLMCACHYVTAGAAMDEFVEWSCNDPKYVDEAEKIRYRWDSLDERHSEPNTAGTIIHAMKHRGEDYGEFMALIGRSDFDELDNAELDDFDEDTYIKEAGVKTGELILEEIQAEDGSFSSVMEFIAALPDSNVSDDMVDRAVRLIANETGTAKAKATRLLMEKADITKGEFAQITKDASVKLKTDLQNLLCSKMMEATFNNGKYVFYYGKQFYIYLGTHWVPVEDEFIGRIALQCLDKLKDKIDISLSDLSMSTGAITLLKHRRSQMNGERLMSSAKAVVNCKDYELHINDRTGDIEIKPHSHTSNLYSVLACKFGDSMDLEYCDDCPLFLDTINDMFSDYPDTDEIVRHLGELFGYMIQPNKNIASIWLFKGPGGDGKSTLLKVLNALMGDSYYAAPSGLIGDGGADTHASSALPGKLCVAIEEIGVNFKLGDRELKSLSESTQLHANPKGKDPFNFQFVGSLLMCSNGYPRLNDLSNGTLDRLNIVHFNKRYRATGRADRDRAKRITEDSGEMAGVLKWALAGLKRLRTRGEFKVPDSCRKGKLEWLRESNPLLDYVIACLKTVPAEERERGRNGKEVPLCTYDELYQHYRDWCGSSGIDDKFITIKKNFKNQMSNYGVVIRESKAGETKCMKVFGVEFNEGWGLGEAAKQDFSGFSDF